MTNDSNMVMPVTPCGTGAGNGIFGNDANGWWIILLFVVLFGGAWGGRGYGYGNSGSGAADNYVLASDFATVQRQLSDGFGGVEKGLDTIRNGMCDGFYTEAQLINGVNMNIAQNGYATQNAINSTGNAIVQQLNDNNYNVATQASNISRQISDCCCENEKIAMQTRFDMAQYNCATNQAIDKVGDRIIDYLANKENQSLRDENQALRLAASQQAQNNYIVNQLRQPSPIPAYTVPNPNCCYQAAYSCCNG